MEKWKRTFEIVTKIRNEKWFKIRKFTELLLICINAMRYDHNIFHCYCNSDVFGWMRRSHIKGMTGDGGERGKRATAATSDGKYYYSK